MLFTIRFIILVLASLSVAGCGAMSATSLRCGTDGDASYVEVISAPQSLSQNTRALAELCAFAYSEDGNDEIT